VIYVCPTRSLCNERVADWKNKFPSIGMPVVEYTGEAVSNNRSDRAEVADLAGARLIVTTPEKMDQLTRRDDNHRHIKDVNLVCLDEIHSVSSDVRGPVLEVLVNRLRKITEARFVCVSATIPNSQDVAKWIGNRDDPHGSARLFNFGAETRPCPLERIVVGLPKGSGTNDFAFTNMLNFKVSTTIGLTNTSGGC
jgi:ATP-dependent DNA helicase HFM1/MER3